jgi:hypothetical protein
VENNPTSPIDNWVYNPFKWDFSTASSQEFCVFFSNGFPNEENPNLSVAPHDRILAINGVSGSWHWGLACHQKVALKRREHREFTIVGCDC